MPKKISIKTPEQKRIEELEKENNLLKARNDSLSQNIDFHEELIIELAMKVYNG